MRDKHFDMEMRTFRMYEIQIADGKSIIIIDGQHHTE